MCILEVIWTKIDHKIKWNYIFSFQNAELPYKCATEKQRHVICYKCSWFYALYTVGLKVGKCFWVIYCHIITLTSLWKTNIILWCVASGNYEIWNMLSEACIMLIISAKSVQNFFPWITKNHKNSKYNFPHISTYFDDI